MHLWSAKNWLNFGTCPLLVKNVQMLKNFSSSISQLPSKFHEHFATPLEYVILSIADLLGAFVY